jgi:hypothetical protein
MLHNNIFTNFSIHYHLFNDARFDHLTATGPSETITAINEDVTASM